jgi:deoxycytidylate deaminase
MEKFIIGLVGSFGSGCTFIANNFLIPKGYGYLSLSSILKDKYLEKNPHMIGADLPRDSLQDFGNEIRKEHDSGYLAKQAISKIEGMEEAFLVVDSFRNPKEIEEFKSHFVNFFVIGVFAEQEIRWQRIRSTYNDDLGKFNAHEARDKGEKYEYGQRVTDCFLLSDVVILNNMAIHKGNDAFKEMEAKINKYLDLFQNKVTNKMPTEAEAIMAIAYANSMRSSCLKRKVGAIIVDDNANVFSSGYNEVPPLERPCKNAYGDCYRNVAKSEISGLFSKEQEDLRGKVMTKVKLLEKCRALHAEENAILNIAKFGSAGVINNATLYTTTYPCNLCANKIAQVKLKKIVYFEPYPVEEAKKTLSEASIQQEMFEGITYNSYFKVYGEIIL